MFRVLKFTEDGISWDADIPIHVARLLNGVYCSIDCDDYLPEVEQWAAYTRSLIPLRLPLVHMLSRVGLAGDDAMVILGGKGALDLQNSSGNKSGLRPAILDEINVANFVWDTLNDVPNVIDDVHRGNYGWLEKPAPLPSSAPNCALAYGLLLLDETLARRDSPPESLMTVVCTVGLLLAAANYELGSRQGKSERSQYAADARWVDDPSQRAKNLASALWPEANRHGRTADQLHREITARGEYASHGRVAKWLTNLRKTGRC